MIWVRSQQSVLSFNPVPTVPSTSEIFPAEAGVPFEVTGISAFQAAAAKPSAELTVPGMVETIIPSRISGREVPAREELSVLAAHQASLLSLPPVRVMEDAQSQLLNTTQPKHPWQFAFA